MSYTFKKHLEKLIQLEESTFSEVHSYFDSQEVKKKEVLMSEGDICRYQFFVERGCLRKYFLKGTGVEQTTEFAIEGWWMTDTFAFENQKQSTFNIQAVEDAEVLRISHEKREALLKNIPEMEHYFRMVYQRDYAAAKRRIRYLYEFSREELYLHFSEHYPEFLQRIPQYLLASFLGFTPEYLSEIRRKYRS